MNNRIMLVWIPPLNWRNSYIYRCTRCNQEICGGMLMAIDSYNFDNVGKNQYLSNIHCAMCEFSVNADFNTLVSNIVRIELKRIIKEEVHDPKGPFSPSDDF